MLFKCDIYLFVSDYGRHKGHRHNLLELEAEKTRTTINVAVNSLKKFMEDVSETSRRLGNSSFVNGNLLENASF